MIITLYAACLIVGGLVLLFQMIHISRLKKLIKQPEIVYVDTSGITPEEQKFTDLIKYKTINFVVEGEKIVIPHVDVMNGIRYIKRIAECFTILSTIMQKNYDNEKVENRNSILKFQTYKQIINLIYKLSKPFAKSKFKYKRILYRKCMTDYVWTLHLVEQILDYWGYVGELTRLLARGGSLKQIHGGSCSWSCISWGIDGKMHVGPRYAL